jgi:Spy/CpxP family protein refolding chaperone
MEQDDPVSKYLSEIGRKGAIARAKRLTPEQRKEIAQKAAKASAKVRSKKAKDRKRRTGKG